MINDYSKEVILFIFAILLFAAFLFGMHKLSEKSEEKLWNDGHCDVCGGTWKYEQAVGHKYETSYIYVCDDCGKRIEISEMR